MMKPPKGGILIINTLLFTIRYKGEMMSMSYECWAYKNGKPWKMIYVNANNRSEAEALAWQKFRSLGIEPERVTCK